MAAEKATIPQCVDALFKAHGNISKAAKLIGCTRGSLSGRIQRHKKLKTAHTESKEQLLDLAEDSLLELIKEKNLGAVCFALKCQGKARGWIENPAQSPVIQELKQVVLKVVESD